MQHARFLHLGKVALTAKETAARDVAVRPPSGARRQAVGDEHDLDVFCLTKGRMHMTAWQPPVLALPYGRLARMGDPCPETCYGRKAVLNTANYKQLSRKLMELPTPMIRASEEIDALLRGGPGPPLPPLLWLAQGPPARENITYSSNLYYEHLPDTSWNLVASFSRAAPAKGVAARAKPPDAVGIGDDGRVED